MKSDCILAIATPSPPEIKWTSGEVQANATTGETEDGLKVQLMNPLMYLSNLR